MCNYLCDMNALINLPCGDQPENCFSCCGSCGSASVETNTDGKIYHLFDLKSKRTEELGASEQIAKLRGQKTKDAAGHKDSTGTPQPTFAKGDKLIYTHGDQAPEEKRGKTESVTVEQVHHDTAPNVYYTIKFENGNERQTSADRLAAAPAPSGSSAISKDQASGNESGSEDDSSRPVTPPLQPTHVKDLGDSSQDDAVASQGSSSNDPAQSGDGSESQQSGNTSNASQSEAGSNGVEALANAAAAFPHTAVNVVHKMVEEGMSEKQDADEIRARNRFKSVQTLQDYLFYYKLIHFLLIYLSFLFCKT